MKKLTLFTGILMSGTVLFSQLSMPLDSSRFIKGENVNKPKLAKSVVKKSLLNTQSKYLLDSIVSYQYNSVTDSVITGITKFGYDNEGNMAMKSSYSWNNELSDWSGNEKQEYTYDKYGNQNSIINYAWDETNMDWDKYTKDEYSFDEKGNVTVEASYNWDYIDAQWIASHKTETQKNGNQTLNASYYWDIDIDQWIGYDKWGSAYDENGNDTLYMHYNWNKTINNWNLLSKDVWTFISKDKVLSRLYYNYDTTNSRKIYTRKYEYSYYESGPEKLIQVFDWNYSIKDWKDYEKTEYLRDSAEKKGTSTTYRKDTIKNSWENLSKSERLFDMNWKSSNNTFFAWDTLSKQWLAYEKNEIVYDSAMHVTLSVSYTWDKNGNFWKGTHKDEAGYDKNGKVTLDARYDWNKNDTSWQGRSKVQSTYDINGNCILSLNYSWDKVNKKWKEAPSVESKFDDFGNLLSAINWDYSMKETNTYDDKLNLLKHNFYSKSGDDWYVTNSDIYYYSVHEKTGVANACKEKGFSIFPNPVKDKLFINNTDSRVTFCLLFNANGQLMKKIQLNEGVNSCEVNNLKSGVYILQMPLQTGIMTKKVIKK